MRHPTRLAVAAVALAGALGLSACGSSSGGGDKSEQPGGGTLKVGLLTDVTGATASSHSDTKIGTDAYINYINAKGGVNGKKIEIIQADTTSTPTGALAAAQKLVEKDDVFAIVENSAFFFGAAQYLLKQGVPVIGSAVDGPTWADKQYTNLFAVSGVHNSDYMSLADGRYMKSRGVTSCAGLGYSDVVSAKKAATAFTKSCEAAGLKTGYLNTQIPVGSTDVGPIALAIKHSGVDGLETALSPSTAFALIGRLHELGVKMKSILLLSGYGSDLLATSSNVKAAQGVDFSTFGYPAEVHNPATDLRRQLLAKQGAKSPPTAGQQYGYLIAVGLVAGLKAAGADPTRDTLTTKMRAIHDFTGDGLLPNKVDFSDYAPSTSCTTVVKLVGKQFVPMKPMPLCAGTRKVF